MKWDNLIRDVVAASRISFSDLLDQHKGEKFYAFILYTDNDCYTILPSANSVEKYNEKILNSPEGMAAYKWYIGEWSYEAWKGDEFDKICKELSVASQLAYENGLFEEFKKNVHLCMINALLLLDREGFFGHTKDDIVLFISSSEYDEAKDLEDRSAKVLNSPEVYDKFLKRYQSA